jgi:DNA (cytosine-5)-methyltransferase 1
MVLRTTRHGMGETGEVKPLRFIDLFAGIGGIRLALESAGAQCVFSSEWDSAAAARYERFFGDKPRGDIRATKDHEIPRHDILAGGFPCQAFSVLGAKRGFKDTRGTLFFEIERILKHRRPRAVLLENVRNLVSHDRGQTFQVIRTQLEELGYTVEHRVLNALDFGLPQKRERVIIVGYRSQIPFQWPETNANPRPLAEILELDETVDASHFVSDGVRASVRERLEGKRLLAEPWICHENKAGNISPRPYSCALRAGASYNYLLVNGKRRLTPRENLRLQGFPDEFTADGPPSHVRKQCGNSVPVPLIAAVARNLAETLMTRSSSRRPSLNYMNLIDEQVRASLTRRAERAAMSS